MQAYRVTCPSSPQGVSLKYSSDIVILEKKRKANSHDFSRQTAINRYRQFVCAYLLYILSSTRHTVIETDWFFQIQSCMLLHTYVIYTNLYANHIYRSLHEYMYSIIMRVHNDNHKISILDTYISRTRISTILFN